MGKRQRRDGSGNISHGGRAADVLHSLPGQGRPMDMPGGGITRKNGDEDDNAGPFSAPV